MISNLKRKVWPSEAGEEVPSVSNKFQTSGGDEGVGFQFERDVEPGRILRIKNKTD